MNKIEFMQCCSYSLESVAHFREHWNKEKLRKIYSIIVVPVALAKYIVKSVKACVPHKEKNGLCVVCIVKDEERYIKEFVDYYQSLGADLLIYDNDSKTPVDSLLGNRGGVELSTGLVLNVR